MLTAREAALAAAAKICDSGRMTTMTAPRSVAATLAAWDSGVAASNNRANNHNANHRRARA